MKINVNILLDYLKWKLFKTWNAPNKVNFWINFFAVVGFVAVIQRNVNLLFACMVGIFAGNLFKEFQAGEWRYELRKEDKKKAVEMEDLHGDTGNG